MVPPTKENKEAQAASRCEKQTDRNKQTSNREARRASGLQVRPHSLELGVGVEEFHQLLGILEQGGVGNPDAKESWEVRQELVEGLVVVERRLAHTQLLH